MLRRGILLCAGLLLLPNLPVNYLEIREGELLRFAAPLSAGTPFYTSIIHSVQLTPVVDDYRVVAGKLWTWEERVQSHNAGLPFDAPAHGSFVVDPPWMIVRGGRYVHEALAYRVGTEALGRNVWHLPPFPQIDAYAVLPSRRVVFSAGVRRLSDAPVVGFEAD
jgi:Uncharacterized conserved protein